MDLGIVWGLFGGPLGVYTANFRRNIFPIFSGSAFGLQGTPGLAPRVQNKPKIMGFSKNPPGAEPQNSEKADVILKIAIFISKQVFKPY